MIGVYCAESRRQKDPIIISTVDVALSVSADRSYRGGEDLGVGV
jgi:hypothetical protein